MAIAWVFSLSAECGVERVAAKQFSRHFDQVSWVLSNGSQSKCRTGIFHGDDPYTRFGKPHNGQLVEMIAKMAHMLGREVATPTQVRELLKMPPRSQLVGMKG